MFCTVDYIVYILKFEIVDEIEYMMCKLLEATLYCKISYDCILAIYLTYNGRKGLIQNKIGV